MNGNETDPSIKQLKFDRFMEKRASSIDPNVVSVYSSLCAETQHIVRGGAVW